VYSIVEEMGTQRQSQPANSIRRPAYRVLHPESPGFLTLG
jgi:hypothetical protein